MNGLVHMVIRRMRVSDFYQSEIAVNDSLDLQIVGCIKSSNYRLARINGDISNTFFLKLKA